MQKSESLRGYLRGEKIDAGRIAARPGEAGYKAKLDRVVTDAKNDWDRRCRSFGTPRGTRANAVRHAENGCEPSRILNWLQPLKPQSAIGDILAEGN